MDLSQETLKTIASCVKGNLAEWMREVGPPVPSTDPQLLERIVRVEELLEHQRGLIERGFARNDQRFDELREDFLARCDEQRAQGRRLFAVLTTILSILTLLVGYGTFVG